ncbi:MAG: hypothetical protein K2G87_03140 [Oscillospiraceae bacterium]|nr:hypothetical protein [Oscillospiraceae bacterium]
MYNIQTLMKAYFSVIKLADSCNSTDETTLSNLYHLVKLTRSAIRDFPQDIVWLDEFKSVLDIYSARLKKRADQRLKQYFIAETEIDGSISDDKGIKRKLHSPLTDSYVAITYFIRQKLKNRETDDFLMLYKIADLYMQHLFQYSDEINVRPDTENLGDINISLCIIISGMGHYIGCLENAMRAEGIKFDEIRV